MKKVVVIQKTLPFIFYFVVIQAIGLSNGFFFCESLFAGDSKKIESIQPTLQGTVEPFWQEKISLIDSLLQKAIVSYKASLPSDAKAVILRAQFDGYKNSLLETAVRKNISRAKDYENNAGFSELVRMVDKGVEVKDLESGVAMLVADLKNDLPGLPLVEGALSKKDARKLAKLDSGGKKNWDNYMAQMTTTIDDGVVLYNEHNYSRAIEKIRDSYFLYFEKTGLSLAVHKKNPELHETLERRYNEIFHLMEDRSTPENIRKKTLQIKKDLNRFGKRQLPGIPAASANKMMYVVSLLFLVISCLAAARFVVKRRARVF